MSIREVHSDLIGHLVTLRAMVPFQPRLPLLFELHVHAPQVTRASDVKPLARVITYSCDTCGYETYQEVSWVCAFILQL